MTRLLSGLIVRLFLWLAGMWLKRTLVRAAERERALTDAIQKGQTMPQVQLLLTVQAPEGLQLTYNGVPISNDPTQQKPLALNIVQGNTAVFPFTVQLTTPPETATDLVITTSISDPATPAGGTTNWLDGVNPPRIAAADLAAGTPVGGLHTISCPATAPVAEIVGINFAVNPVTG